MSCRKLIYFEDREEGAIKPLLLKNTGSLSKKVQPEKKRYSYYPFGLSFNSFKREESTPNKYLFNGIERIDDLDLGWDIALYRSYDPAIGRWGQLDPKTSERESPYVGMGNNPIFYSDPLGDTVDIEPKPVPKPDTKPKPEPKPDDKPKPKPDDGTTNAAELVIPIPVVEPIVIPKWFVTAATSVLRQTLLFSLLTLSGDTPQKELFEIRNPAQDKPLSPGEIAKLKRKGWDHSDKGKRGGQRDLYKDKQGNVYEKPKGGKGEGEPIGYNIYD